jgi:hypothetical protein
MTRLSDEHLDELLRLEARTPKAPWCIGHVDEHLDHAFVDDAEGTGVAEVFPRAAQSFIPAARNALKPLLEEVRELRKERKAMRDGLDKADDLLRGWMKSDRRLREALEWIAATHLCLASTDDAQLNAASLRALVEKARAALKGDGA